MTTPHPQAETVDRVEQALKSDPATWKPWVTACLAERVEDALAGNKARLLALSQTLISHVREVYRAAPPEVQAAVRGEGSDAVRAAYQLGQLSFAQLLVSQAVGHRVDDDFLPMLQSERHAPLVRQLASHEDSSIASLAAGSSLAETEVRTRLQELVHKGACDFRKIDKVALYFLTPAGKSGWELITLR